MNILRNYRPVADVELFAKKCLKPSLACFVFFMIVFPDVLRLLPESSNFLKLFLGLFLLPVCNLLIAGNIAGFRNISAWNNQLLWQPGRYFSWSLTLKLFLFTFILSLLLSNLMQKIGSWFHITMPPQELVKLLAQSSPAACILIGIAVIIFAPLSEELFYRHILFNSLVGKTGALWAAILVSLLFSVSHMNLM